VHKTLQKAIKIKIGRARSVALQPGRASASVKLMVNNR
jgi:hypothetical protein